MTSVEVDRTGIVRDYFGFLDAFGARMRQGTAASMPSSPLLEGLPGLEALLSSFPVASATQRMVSARRIEDWNPLGQRLLLPDETPVPASEFERDFALLPMAAQTLVEWAHEAMHLLAIEPWCTGQRPFDNEEEFREWYLGAEGLSYWYADIVVTRAIRQLVPEAELVYARSAVSNAGFHPEAAFRSEGVTGTDALAGLYIEAFLGRDGLLLRSADPLARHYGARIQGFYRDSNKTLNALWNVLQQQDFVEGYWSRFCAIESLPALFEARSVSEPAASELRRIGLKVLPALAKASPRMLARVRARRAAQIRAWHGWSLSAVMRQNWIVSDATLDRQALDRALESYLDAMEQALHYLAGDREPSQVERAIEAADHAYASEVQRPLAAARAGTRYRYWIFPYFEASGGLVGIWDRRSDYTAGEAADVLRFVSERSEWTSESVLAQAEALRALAQMDQAPAQAQDAFNAAMLLPEIRAVWSIALGELSPAENRFRELVFEFH